jgi:hypothetical protein
VKAGFGNWLANATIGTYLDLLLQFCSFEDRGRYEQTMIGSAMESRDAKAVAAGVLEKRYGICSGDMSEDN